MVRRNAGSCGQSIASGEAVGGVERTVRGRRGRAVYDEGGDA